MRLSIHACFLLTASACSAPPTDTAAPAANAAAPSALPGALQAELVDTTEHVSLPTRVRLSDQVVRDANIASSIVYADALPVTVELTGEVNFDPDRAADVTARAAGRIVAVTFQEGDHVERGAPLVVVESPDLAQARANVRVSATRLQLAKQDAQRLTSLSKRALASQQEAAMAEGELASAQAAASAASQILASYGADARDNDTGARLTIRAPVGGHILMRRAIFGQPVTGDTLLATIADFDEAWFIGRLFEKDLALASQGSIAEVRLNAYPGLPFVGVVASIGRQIDPVARTAVARVRIKDQQGTLKAGLFGVAKLTAKIGADRTRTLLAPVTAVTRIGGRDVVFVHEPDGEFALHTVTLGRSAAGRVQVLAGLNPSERVVHDGVFVLKSAVLKATFGEEE